MDRVWIQSTHVSRSFPVATQVATSTALCRIINVGVRRNGKNNINYKMGPQWTISTIWPPCRNSVSTSFSCFDFSKNHLQASSKESVELQESSNQRNNRVTLSTSAIVSDTNVSFSEQDRSSETNKYDERVLINIEKRSDNVEDEEDNTIGTDSDFLVGYKVYKLGDTLNSIGEVVEIVDLPHGRFLLRLAPSMVLIPFEEGIILTCDEETEALVIDPPYGLLEVKEDLEKVKLSIRKMMMELQLDAFPSYEYLAKDPELYDEVMRLGGRYFCARAMNVKFEKRASQPGTWDKKGVRAQLLMYMGLNDEELEEFANEGIEVEMPRSTTLIADKRWELHKAIVANGGYGKVAHMLGWQYNRKVYKNGRKSRVGGYPIGSELDEELRKCMSDMGLKNSLPKLSVLKVTKPHLFRGIIRDGGHNVVSKRMGIKPISKKKGPKMSFEHLIEEIEAFNKENGIFNRFPSTKELARSRCDILYWLRKYGVQEVSEYMNLERPKSGRPRRSQ